MTSNPFRKTFDVNDCKLDNIEEITIDTVSLRLCNIQIFLKKLLNNKKNITLNLECIDVNNNKIDEQFCITLYQIKWLFENKIFSNLRFQSNFGDGSKILNLFSILKKNYSNQKLKHFYFQLCLDDNFNQYIYKLNFMNPIFCETLNKRLLLNFTGQFTSAHIILANLNFKQLTKNFDYIHLYMEIFSNVLPINIDKVSFVLETLHKRIKGHKMKYELFFTLDIQTNKHWSSKKSLFDYIKQSLFKNDKVKNLTIKYYESQCIFKLCNFN